jgi:hypothetical protein
MADRGRHRGRAGADAALVTALAVGATAEQAAERAGVSARTVHRRLADAEFKRRVDDARAELLGRAMARLSAATTEAVTTLVLLLKADVPPAVRLGAARSILDTALRWREQDELARRLDNVESWIEAIDAKSETGGARARRRRG